MGYRMQGGSCGGSGEKFHKRDKKIMVNTSSEGTSNSEPNRRKGEMSLSRACAVIRAFFYLRGINGRINGMPSVWHKCRTNGGAACERLTLLQVEMSTL